MAHIVRHWADLIAASRLSEWLQDHLWVVPASQSVHIAAVSVLFAAAVFISFRLLHADARARPVPELIPTLIPWMRGALAVLLITGIVQTIAEPVRQFVTPAFWSKMLMIVIVMALTEWFARSVRTHVERWDDAAHRPAARLFAVTSVTLWVLIIFCGRFIGYTWERYA